MKQKMVVVCPCCKGTLRLSVEVSEVTVSDVVVQTAPGGMGTFEYCGVEYVGMIATLRAIRERTRCGLKEAKDLFDAREVKT